MSTTSAVDHRATVPPVRTQMQRPRADDPADQRDPLTARDVLALLIAPLGGVLMMVMSVLVIAAMPWQGGLLLAGVVLLAGGMLLGTRQA